ncbi:DUF1615 domain-containing protein [Dyella sp.]|uniref:DUF1615 domain-containing protein n=1 Tax=Dyella sp. TaxID=1869338 RepID=UPI002D76F250|nr:DUF1615 domain-containing protein [Dyella sp.]HET6432484.1 DUF1615 domain-containing protein [Dyella sp.]
MWLAALIALVAGCATQTVESPGLDPAKVQARIIHALPAGADDRAGWARDITAAFAAQQIEPNRSNLCAALAVAGQESNFQSDPAVPGLGRIARAEINRRAAAHHIPQLLVRGALALHGPDGRSYADRIAQARTERELSRAYEDFIGMVPLGRRLFGDANPVHTGGPMQVSVAFAENYAREHDYPYPVDGSIRHEVFSRRGGLYFGIAHLLGYPADYPSPLYRFADYNAGFYASRNAAFQAAVTRASGIPLAQDGDLVSYSLGERSNTELAVRTLADRLKLDDGEIHRDLSRGETAAFAATRTYARVFALADRLQGKPLPRATLPTIRLESPKISRKLTTAWFARRVDSRYRSCMTRMR